MHIDQVVATDALLDYSLTTAPAPVQVSQAETDPSYASLTFVISTNAAHPSVTVSQFTFEIPVRNASKPPAATDLADPASGIKPSISDPAWQINPGAGPGLFVAKPINGKPITITNQGIFVSFNNIQVSMVVGTATVTVVESATTTPDSGAPTPRTCALAVPKFPYAFYAGNLTLEKPLIQNGQPAVLTWTGSENAKYTLLFGTHSVDVSNERTYTTLPLTETTTFILEVAAQVGGQTVKVYFTATQVVANPSIVAKELAVLTTSKLEGPLTVGTTPTPAQATVNGPLSVTGTITTPTVQAVSAIVSGSLTANAATIAALGTPQTATSGTAATDGFVIGWVGCPPNSERSRLCNTVITLSLNGTAYAQATGGNVLIGFINPNIYGGVLAGSAIMPVPKGAKWSTDVEAVGGTEITAPTGFWWVSLGGTGQAPEGEASTPIQQETLSLSSLELGA
jgi:hypothetical protein